MDTTCEHEHKLEMSSSFEGSNLKKEWVEKWCEIRTHDSMQKENREINDEFEKELGEKPAQGKGCVWGGGMAQFCCPYYKKGNTD